jgi:hypothetical protein
LRGINVTAHFAKDGIIAIKRQLIDGKIKCPHFPSLSVVPPTILGAASG